VAIAQQLAWLAALTYDHGDLKETKYAYACVRELTDGSLSLEGPSADLFFDVSVNLEKPPQEDESSSCWTEILGPSVLITGYPTKKRRPNERGLEASPQTMAKLAGIPAAVTFGGGFVFKGPYHALVPIEKFDTSIQWHVIASTAENGELEWRDILKHCPIRVRHDGEQDNFWTARSFFGWCESVVCDLGTGGKSTPSGRPLSIRGPSGCKR